MSTRGLLKQTRTSELIRWLVDEKERSYAARRFGIVAEMNEFSMDVLESNGLAMTSFLSEIEEEIDRRCPS